MVWDSHNKQCDVVGQKSVPWTSLLIREPLFNFVRHMTLTKFCVNNRAIMQNNRF